MCYKVCFMLHVGRQYVPGRGIMPDLTRPGDIIVRPLITEKSMDTIADKRYTFEVRKDATRADVAAAVEATTELVNSSMQLKISPAFSFTSLTVES